jgi:rhodanese-related sulfurtransferase
VPRHLLQHLTAIAALTTALVIPWLGACVDEPPPAARSSKVVLPNLSGPERRPAPSPTRIRQRPTTLPPSPGLFSGPQTVDPARVQQHLGNANQRILDLRPARQFHRGHLPGAHNDPEGRALLAAFRAHRREGTNSPLATGPKPPSGQTLVLVHGGRNLRDLAVAARTYLVLYAGGAAPGTLAILRGGYASWRRQRRPRTTYKGAPAKTTVSKSKPAPPGKTRLRRPVLLTDRAALTTARKRVRTLLVHTDRRRPAPGPRRASPAPAPAPAPSSAPAPLRFGVASLEPAPGERPHSTAALRRRFAPLLRSKDRVRLIAWSKHGLWASLVWFLLKTRLNRSDALNAVFLGPAPGPLPMGIFAR